MALYEFTVYDSLVRNARIFHDRTAVLEGDARLTYAELLAAVDRLAAGLNRRGIRKRDRIAVLSQNCLHYLTLYLAAAKAGAIVVPINWRFQPEEVEFVLTDTTPKMLAAGPGFTETASSLAARLDFIQTKVSFGEPFNGFLAFDDLFDEAASSERESVLEQDDYVIIHTAAVQAKPRGAVLSHRNFVATNLAWMTSMLLTEQDAHLCTLPLYHIAGLAVATSMVHCGGKNIIMPKFDAKPALELIQREKATVFFSFPPIITMLLDELDKGPYDVSSVRHVGGLEAPETIARFEEAFKAKFWVGYGQTETMGFTTFCSYAERPGSAGKESPLTVIKLVDDYDKEVEAGQPGEICVRGPMVFNGYWNLNEDTNYAFREGWHHTGDIGRLDEDGYLFYVKRKAEKELIKPGGENVYPAEVEKAVLEHPDLVECSVIGVPDKEWGEAIKAVCVKTPGSALSEPELKDFVASKIARYKKPKFVVFVESLPKTKEGDIDRARVKEEHGGQY